MFSKELQQAKNPIFVCLFDVESMLMLHSLPEMPLMVFPDCWVDKYPLEIIEKMELTAFYQKPVYVKNGIGYYNINGKAVPFRLTKEVKCSDITPKWVWDLTIVPSSVSKRYVV